MAGMFGLQAVDSFLQGTGFGAGYGMGVRFGYTDLYPAMRQAISRLPIFGTGFDAAQNLKAPQPQPLKLPDFLQRLLR